MTDAVLAPATKKILAVGSRPHRIKPFFRFLQKLSTLECYECAMALPEQAELVTLQDDRALQNPAVAFHSGIKRQLPPILEAVRNDFADIARSFFYLAFFEGRIQSVLSDLNHQLDVVRKFITNFSPDVILVDDDRANNSFLHAFLKAASDAHIPVVVPYMATFSSEEDLLENRKKRPRLYKRNALTIRLFKSMKRISPDLISENHSFYLLPDTFALHRFGTLPPRPWFVGSGNCQLVCLGDYKTKREYEAVGLNQAKYAVVGDLIFDELFQSRLQPHTKKIALQRKYLLNPSLDMLLVSLPPLAEHEIMGWNEHWNEMDFLLSNLKKHKVHILVSLHPRSDPARYRFMEAKYQVSILEEPLADVLPVCDYFVAGYSSTLIWSLLCGIKSLVLGYHHKSDMLSGYTSFYEVTQKQQLAESIQTMLTESADFREDWKTLEKEALFDGKVLQRYHEIFQSI